MSSTSQFGWHPNVIHLDPLPLALSLILQLLVSLLIESKACLSLVSKCRKNSKRAWNKPSLLTQTLYFLWSLFIIEQHCHPLAVSFNDSAFYPHKLCCRGYWFLWETAWYSAFRAQWWNLKWNGSRRFRSGPLLSKRTMNIDFRVIGRKG